MLYSSKAAGGEEWQGGGGGGLLKKYIKASRKSTKNPLENVLEKQPNELLGGLLIKCK